MNAHDESSGLGFPQKGLPWLMLMLALVVGLMTMSQSVTLDSLGVVSKVTGWDWSPKVSGPLMFLVTLPIALWVDVSNQAIALNYLTLLMAAGVIYQLARSVALLPQDRTRDQRIREQSDYSLLSLKSAWLPPVFAGLVCLLQSTFWEHATAATGEMIDLLLFSILIRCLLEFRLSRQDRWLNIFALLYGVSVTNNWAMIAYFPVFAVSLIWIRGLSELQGRFLLRMMGLGLAGLSLYLVLPLWITSHYDQSATFFDYLQLQLGNQKSVLVNFPKPLVVVLSLTSLVPVVAAGIRWPSTMGDTSAAGALLQNLMFKVMHLVFLTVCIWVCFDPAFSPRERGLGLPFLSFYYLSALSVGYYSGYVLLVFGPAPERAGSRGRHRSNRSSGLNPLFRGLLYLATLAVPVGLFVQNGATLKLRNGPALEKLALKQVESVAPGKAVLFVDDSFRGLLTNLGLSLSPQHNAADYSVVDTSALSNTFYQGWIRGSLQRAWSGELGQAQMPQTIDIGSILNVVAVLIKSHPVYYMQSSFGVYFEYLYPESLGLCARLRAFQPGDTNPLPPKVTDEQVAKVVGFWEDLDKDIPSIAEGVDQGESTAEVLGGMLAVEINNRATTLQRQGYLEASASLLKQAARYAPKLASLEYNLKAQALLEAGGSVEELISDTQWKELITTYRSVDLMLKSIGEVNAPRFLYNLGAQLFAGGNFRQAIDRFDAASSLSPENARYLLARANATINLGFPEVVLEQVEGIQASSITLEATQEAELIRLKALALYGQGNRMLSTGQEQAGKQAHLEAESILKEGRKAFPKSELMLDTLAQVYFFSERYDETIQLCDDWLRIDGKSSSALQTKAVALMRKEQFDLALPVLDVALKTYPDNQIFIMNRAISHLRLENLDAALTDYRMLEALNPDPNHAVLFGLAEIARLKGDRAQAIEYYQTYLIHAPQGTEEFLEVSQRLDQLRQP